MYTDDTLCSYFKLEKPMLQLSEVFIQRSTSNITSWVGPEQSQFSFKKLWAYVRIPPDIQIPVGTRDLRELWVHLDGSFLTINVKKGSRIRARARAFQIIPS